MSTQVLRDHDVASHFLVHHLPFPVPARTITHRYCLKPRFILSSNIAQDFCFGDTLRDPCGPRAKGQEGAHSLTELLRGSIVENRGKGR